MTTPHFVRLLRTPASERFLIRLRDDDVASLDLHYLQDLTVQATLVLFEGSSIAEPDVPDLLNQIDEVLLPEARLDDRTLSFTVVVGRVLGAFSAERTD